jgi:DMSO/TMAO reductase YedYZ molybdopterin-dependent catalytic subunit/predicted DNA-binding protein (UPF0251 family)
VRRFFGLANQHMRWQLNDLGRRLDERPAAAELRKTGVAAPPSSTASDLSPDGRRMLEVIEGLREDEREVFDLVGIQGLTHAEVAMVVGVSEKTVQRRLNRARLLLAERLADLRPATSCELTPPPGDTPPALRKVPMASNPQVLELLEEVLNSGKTPEEVCRDCLELLPEVRRAVGHAEWSGVPLRTIIERAGLAEVAKEIVFYGADCGVEHGHDEPTAFARSLPLDKALHPDTLLATHMNGEILEPSRGYPLRLIVPGWYGVASVKWLTRIEAVTAPFQGYYQTVKYTIKHRTGGGVRTDVVGPMPVKSEIIRPIDGSVLGIGANRLFGMAWAGEHAVAAVEVSVDGGVSWQRAELQGPRTPYSWNAWEYLWETAASGDYKLLSRAISEAGHVQPMDHDFDRGGYLITFSRPINVRLDAGSLSTDFVGDVTKLQRDMAAVARERSSQPLDADIALMSGAGI